MIKFSTAAQANIDETGCSPEDDIYRIRTGEQTREGLLAYCLDGADPDRVQGWREYVATICEEAAQGDSHANHDPRDPVSTCDECAAGVRLRTLPTRQPPLTPSNWKIPQ